MFTPQQIEQISFSRATFGGYDIQSVDEFLEPLTEDYITLYKENALLKSKMRILVSKLEEYRKNEAAAKESPAEAAVVQAPPVAQPEEKTVDSAALIAEAEARVAEARRVAAAHISKMEQQLKACLEELEAMKSGEFSIPAHDETKVVADEISQNLVAMMGEIEEPAPKAAPKHPTQEATTKFTSLKFGPNYNPTK